MDAASTKYSVAIRTLALNHQMLRAELESIFGQTIKPEKVVLYIAEGYEIPDFRVANEVYVPVKKGMVAQRALPYTEIHTPLILLLDDDVLLDAHAVETLIRGLDQNQLDCISPDTFANHRMSRSQKLYAAITNFTFPHSSDDYAFRIKSNGSFDYIDPPKRSVYLSQSAGGPAALWRTSVLRGMRFADELWLDSLGFAYNDDQLEFYKLYRNGGRLGILFDDCVKHMGGKTASEAYHRSADSFAIRAKAMYLVWLRSIYGCEQSKRCKLAASLSFWLKIVWGGAVHIAAAVAMRNARIPIHYLRGIRHGIRMGKSQEFRSLPPYAIK